MGDCKPAVATIKAPPWRGLLLVGPVVFDSGAVEVEGDGLVQAAGKPFTRSGVLSVGRL